MSYCAAPVAFPTCWFINVAAYHDPSMWPVGDSICHTHGNLAGLTSLRADCINNIVAIIGLACITGIQNGITSGRPAGYAARGGFKGQALGDAAERRHDVNFAWAFFAAHKC